MEFRLTPTEENYLKAIYKANERTRKSASTNIIAESMQTSAASVTDMMKKLSQKELIQYEKYHGARLTAEGSRIATALIRRHRLWETFLVNKLEFSWEEVHEIAEELEHVNSDKLISHLDRFLGYPKFDPHGDPIPNAEGKFTLREQRTLSFLKTSEKGTIIGVKDHKKPFLNFLNEKGISIGSHITVVDKSAFDNSMTILLDENEQVLLTQKSTDNLLVRPK